MNQIKGLHQGRQRDVALQHQRQSLIIRIWNIGRHQAICSQVAEAEDDHHTILTSWVSLETGKSVSNNLGALWHHFVTTIPRLNSVSTEVVQSVLIGAAESGSWAVFTNATLTSVQRFWSTMSFLIFFFSSSNKMSYHSGVVLRRMKCLFFMIHHDLENIRYMIIHYIIYCYNNINIII